MSWQGETKMKASKRLRADFSKREVVETDNLSWLESPSSGVTRRKLERIGEEVGRATSIVRYEAGASFDSHVHDGGEEIFVLSGTFEDEHGSYPQGTYVRNPIGSQHAPKSTEGCELFVKLHQFQKDDNQRVVVPTQDAEFSQGQVDGLSVLSLHRHKHESVALVRWAPGTEFVFHQHWGGEEIFVLEGTFSDEHGDYPAGSWIRSPHLSGHHPYSEDGCLIYVKTGHLNTDRQSNALQG